MGDLFKNATNLNHQDTEKIEGPLLGFVIVVHAFMILLAVFGNSIVVYLVLFNNKLRNVRNAFMLNLTLSNLLLVSICTPSFLLTLLFPNWTPGDFWCKFLHSIQIVITLVCAFSIMMIAVDRWMFIVYARSRQFTSRGATFAIIIIWIIALLLAAPTFFHRKTKELYDESFRSKLNDLLKDAYHRFDSAVMFNLTNPNKTEVLSNPSFMLDGKMSTEHNLIYCVEHWENPTLKRVYILILFGLEFVLPFVSMLITYVWIIQFLRAQNDKMSHYEQLRKKLIQKERPHQKSCKLLSALCLTFIICCLPLSLFNIKTEFDMGKFMESNTYHQEKEIYSPLTILTTLEVLNTVISPLLYGWMNHNFRNEINEKVKLFKSKYSKVNTIQEKPSSIKKCQLMNSN